MSKFIVEILDEINQDPSTVVKYKDHAALKILFQYAFDPKNKFLLPEGTPPYKEDVAPLGMSPTNFTMEMRRLYIFLREDLGKIRRESLFISLLEGLHPSEAKVLLAVKDQRLPEIYANLTHKFVYESGLIDIAPELEEELPKQEAPVEPEPEQPAQILSHQYIQLEEESQPKPAESSPKRKGRPKKNGANNF